MNGFVLRAFSTRSILRQSEIVLRDYQLDCISRCMNAFENGKRRIAVSLATGGGKTVIFSSLIKFMPKNNKKVLVLVHRKELANQAYNVCSSMMPEKSIQIDLGMKKADGSGDIVIGSIQSLNNRLMNYDPKDFDLIIIDEAHHAAAKSYLNIVSHFEENNPNINIVGFSATLNRHDQKSLTKIMDHVVFHKGLDDMINEGWLCDAKFTTIKDEDLDLSEVTTRQGDFVVSRLGIAVNTDKSNELILKTYLKFKEEEKLKTTLIFAVDVNHVQSLNSLFLKNGIRSSFVTGTTKQMQRDSIIENFKNGNIDVLINCGIFTEGTDIPNIDSLILARPTKSNVLLLQMIGRGLRKHADKRFCHIISFIPNKAEAITAPTLYGVDYNVELNKMNIKDLKTIVNKKQERNFDQLVDKKDFIFEHFDSLNDYLFKSNDDEIFKNSQFPFIKTGDNVWSLSLINQKYLRIIRKDETYEVKLYEKNSKFQGYSSKLILKNLKKEEILSKLVNYLLKYYPEDLKFLNTVNFWRFKPPSKVQIEMVFDLMKKHSKNKDIEYEIFLKNFIKDKLTRGSCSDLLFSKMNGNKKHYLKLNELLLKKFKEKNKPVNDVMRLEDFQKNVNVNKINY